MKVKRIAARLAVAGMMATALAGGAVGTSNTASAAGGCRGYMQERIPLEKVGQPGRYVGHVELWYSSANGGTNCVMTYDDSDGPAWMSTSVKLSEWSEYPGADNGYYNTYAGPYSITGTNGHCVSFYGSIDKYGNTYSYKSEPTHCG